MLSGGLLTLDRPKDYARYTRSFSGQFVELTIRKQRTTRSSRANSFYWAAVVPAIAEAAGYTKDEAHEALKHHLLKEDGDGPLVKVRSTAALSVEEFSTYTEEAMALGATMFGIEWEAGHQ